MYGSAPMRRSRASLSPTKKLKDLRKDDIVTATSSIVAETDCNTLNEHNSREQRKFEMIMKTIRKMEQASERKKTILQNQKRRQSKELSANKKSKRRKALRNREKFIENYSKKCKQSSSKCLKEKPSSAESLKFATNQNERKPIKIAIKKSQFGSKQFYIDNSKFKSDSKISTPHCQTVQAKEFRWDSSKYLKYYFDVISNTSLEYDVTLSCLNNNPKRLYVFQAHKVLLCAASPVFANLILDYLNEPKRPIIHLKGISQEVISDIIEFIYTGTVKVSFHQLGDFSRAAEMLKLRGVVKNDINNFKIVLENYKITNFSLNCEIGNSYPETLNSKFAQKHDNSQSQLCSKTLKQCKNNITIDLTYPRIQFIPVHTASKSKAIPDLKFQAQIEEQALLDIEAIIAGVTNSAEKPRKS